MQIIFKPLHCALELADHFFVLIPVAVHGGLFLFVGANEGSNSTFILVHVEFLGFGGEILNHIVEVGNLTL